MLDPMRARIFLLAAVFLVPAAARADADWNAGFAARSRTPGAIGFVQGGYGLLLWGEKREGEFRYGYLRAVGTAFVAAVTNRAEAALELYPISILGIRLGHGQSVRGTEPSVFDCDLAACKGRLGATTLKISLAGGYGDVFLVGSLRGTEFDSSNVTRPFADEMSLLLGTPGGDRMVTSEAVAGVKLDERNRVGLRVQADRMLGTASRYAQQSLFAQHRWERWSISLAAGPFQTTLAAPGIPEARSTGFAAGLFAKWTGIGSLALGD
jgi:hypothetical protein